MIPAGAPLAAAWLPIAWLVVTQHEPRNLDRVAWYLDLLQASPLEHCGPPLAVQPQPNGTYAILDGHHRFMAHLLAGRSVAPCVIIGEPRIWPS